MKPTFFMYRSVIGPICISPLNIKKLPKKTQKHKFCHRRSYNEVSKRRHLQLRRRQEMTNYWPKYVFLWIHNRKIVGVSIFGRFNFDFQVWSVLQTEIAKLWGRFGMRSRKYYCELEIRIIWMGRYKIFFKLDVLTRLNMMHQSLLIVTILNVTCIFVDDLEYFIYCLQQLSIYFFILISHISRAC